MDCTDKNVWGEHLICGNQGKCIVNDQGLGVCNCAEGFTHDLFYVRFRDCSVPIATHPFMVYNILVMIYSILLCAASIYQSSKAKSLARISLRILSFTTISSFFRSFTHYLGGNNNNPISSFFFFLVFSFAGAQAYLMLYSQVIPMYRISHLNPSAFIQRCTFFYAFFRIVYLTNIGLSFQVGDPLKIENDFMWNTLVMINIFFIGVEVCLINLQMMIETKNLINHIESLPTFEVRNRDRASNMRQYVEKLKRLRRMVIYLSPMAIPPMFLAPILFFCTGYFPYHWIVYMIESSMLLLGSIEYLRYAMNDKVHSDTTSSSSGMKGRLSFLSFKNDVEIKAPELNQT